MKLNEVLDQLIALEEQHKRLFYLMNNLLYSESKRTNNHDEFCETIDKVHKSSAEAKELSLKFSLKTRELMIDGKSLESWYDERARLTWLVDYLEQVLESPEEIIGEDKDGETKTGYLSVDLEKIQEIYAPLKEELDIVNAKIKETLENTEID